MSASYQAVRLLRISSTSAAHQALHSIAAMATARQAGCAPGVFRCFLILHFCCVTHAAWAVGKV